MTSPSPQQLAAESLSGLRSRTIPRLASIEHEVKGANDLGDNFRCQLGKHVQRIETGVIPGSKDGVPEKWVAEYFVCSYVGPSWEAVLAKVARGERAAA